MVDLTSDESVQRHDAHLDTANTYQNFIDLGDLDMKQEVKFSISESMADEGKCIIYLFHYIMIQHLIYRVF